MVNCGWGSRFFAPQHRQGDQVGIKGATVYRSPSEIAGTRPYFMLPPDSDPAWWDGRGGAPEATLINWAAQLIEPGEIFFDVGAHVGTWSLTYALRGCIVWAFEAQPWLVTLLKAGKVLNEIGTNLLVVSKAIGAAPSAGTIRAPHPDGGGGSIVRDFENPAIKIDVAIEPLDNFVGGLNPTLIKIDVEGAELDVLRGAQGTIKRAHPKIIFECWEDERGQRKEDLFRYLHDELHYRTLPVWTETWLAEPNQG